MNMGYDGELFIKNCQKNTFMMYITSHVTDTIFNKR